MAAKKLGTTFPCHGSGPIIHTTTFRLIIFAAPFNVGENRSASTVYWLIVWVASGFARFVFCFYFLSSSTLQTLSMQEWETLEHERE